MPDIATQKKDLLSLADLDASTLQGLLHLATALKRGEGSPSLHGKTLALLLEKPSLRTRVSFEMAMHQLGGWSISLGQQEVGLGTRELAADTARVLSRYVSIIAARVYDHRTLEELARYATTPVVNALSDREHPSQALADLLTIREHLGRLEGITVAFVGDGNNCAASLALGCALTGARFRIASPPGYELSPEVAARAREVAPMRGWAVEQTHDPRQAARESHVIYTDAWVSMGQEAESEPRRRAFAGFQVTPDLMATADPQAIFLHPLPAHHGEEVSADMLDHPRSAVFDQAENRLHVQKAILAYLLGAAPLPR